MSLVTSFPNIFKDRIEASALQDNMHSLSIYPPELTSIRE